MRNRLPANLVSLLLAILLRTELVLAQSQPLSTQLAHLAENGTMESAGSHGSLGYSVALTAQSYLVPEFTRQIEDHLAVGVGQNSEQQYTTLQGIQIIKGLSWPVDLGVNVSGALQGSLVRLGVFSQYTLFEAFQMPALALRYRWNQVTLMQRARAINSEVAFAMSYAFNRFLVLFSEVAQGRTQVILNLPNTEDRLARNQLFRIGCQLIPLPPYFRIGGEVTWKEAKVHSLGLKAAIGL